MTNSDGVFSGKLSSEISSTAYGAGTVGALEWNLASATVGGT